MSLLALRPPKDLVFINQRTDFRGFVSFFLEVFFWKSFFDSFCFGEEEEEEEGDFLIGDFF